MTKPVILAVDDDPVVLGAIARDLRQRYRVDYRVVRAGSGPEGLEAARQLAARNAQVALFLVDQRMPGMTGLELLAETAKLHPQSRRVLLTAYADTDVAIAGINQIGLDHYLMKPWTRRSSGSIPCSTTSSRPRRPTPGKPAGPGRAVLGRRPVLGRPAGGGLH